MAMTGLHHIGIHVKNIEETLAFYTEKLGFTVTRRLSMGDMELAFARLGDCKLEFICAQGAKERDPYGRVEHVCIAVDDIRATHAALLEKGVVFDVAEPAALPAFSPTAANIFFNGPSGERLELFQD